MYTWANKIKSTFRILFGDIDALSLPLQYSVLDSIQVLPKEWAENH